MFRSNGVSKRDPNQGFTQHFPDASEIVEPNWLLWPLVAKYTHGNAEASAGEWRGIHSRTIFGVLEDQMSI